MSMNISADLVKQLRDRTNAPYMDCRRALIEANGDLDKAIEFLQVSGQAKAVKKAGRIASEGTIIAEVSSDGKKAVILEVNCETDFVARQEQFKDFAKQCVMMALQEGVQTIEALQAKTDSTRLNLVAQLGENISLRRLVYESISDGVIVPYLHGASSGGSARIGVLVTLKKGNANLGKDLAMQIAAMNPEFLNKTEIPAARLEKEKEIFIQQTREEGKPEAMLEKIAMGKLQKFTNELTLLGQPFVKDSTKSIETLLKEQDAEIQRFVRFQLGEGIEKKETNFADEVMAQVRGA